MLHANGCTIVNLIIMIRPEDIRIQTLSESVPDYLIRIDRDGNYLDFKSNGNDLFPQQGSIIGKNIREVLPAAFAEKLQKKIIQTLDTGELQEAEFNFGLASDNNLILNALFIREHENEVLIIIRDITKFKKAEQALADAYAEQRALMDANTDGLIFVDNNGVIIDSNEINAAFFGLSLSDFVGKSLFDMYSSFFSDEYNEFIKEEVFKKGRALKSETTLNNKWYEYAIHPIVNDRNIVEKALVIARNITEKKDTLFRLEKALKENRENSVFLENLINNFPDVIGIHDTEHRIIRYNKAGYEFFQTTPEEINGKLYHELRHQNEFCEHSAVLFTLETKKSGETECFDEKKNRWFLTHTYPIFDENGVMKQIIEHIHDITQIKNIEAALRESEMRYKELFNSSAGGILIGSPDGKIIQLNTTFLTMTGYTAKELIGQNFSNKLFTEESLKKTPFQTELIKQGKTVTSRRTIIAADGRLIHVEMHSRILPDESYHTIFYDISERLEAEEKIIKQNEQLSKINIEKDKFFSIIAHDLRSPFTSFLGLTEMMADEFDSLNQDEIRLISSELKKSAVNLYSLLENLLEWSMVQRNIKPFRPRELNLLSTVDRSSETILEIALKKHIRVVMDISEEIKVMADEPMLETIFRNLLSNAVKFTSHGGLIMLLSDDNDNGMVEIKVIDNGIGIPDEMMETLFSITGRNNRPGTAGEPSTGLGLPICKEFIEKNGGKISVKSTPGKGSIFSFTLPKA